MPYKLLGYQELDYAVGTGGQTMVNPGSPTYVAQEGDIWVLFIEYQGGDTKPSITGWTEVYFDETGTGTAHAAAIALAHRHDGVTDPSLFVADTGNHQSISLHTIRGSDRTVALASLPGTVGKDTTADVNYFLVSASGASSGAAASQDVFALLFNGAANDHGGGSWGYPTDSGDWAKTAVRNSQHTSGSDGSHFVSLLQGDGAAGATQPRYTGANAGRDVRIAIYFLAHEYNDYVRSVSDGLTSSDSIGRVRSVTRALADAIGLSDAVGRATGYTRAIADALGLADAAARAQGRLREVSDGLALSDSVERLFVIIRATSDTLGLSDAVAASRAFTRDVADSLIHSDVVTRQISKIRNLTDSLTLSQVVKPLVYGIRAVVTDVLEPLTRIKTTVRRRTYVEDTVAPLTDIEVEISSEE